MDESNALTTLEDFRDYRVVVACACCHLEKRLDLEKLASEHGKQADMLDLIAVLRCDCGAVGLGLKSLSSGLAPS